MKFFDLLTNLYGFDLQKAGKVVLVRNILGNITDEREPKYVKRSPENFEEWQRIQQKKNPPKKGTNKRTRNQGASFWGCSTVVSFCQPEFYGDTGGHARFVGVFRNDSDNEPVKLNIDKHLSPELAEIYRKREKLPPYSEEALYFFNFRREDGYEDLENRIIVNWDYCYGQSRVLEYNPRKPKALEVLEFLPRGHVLPFPGIEKCMLSFSELQGIVKDPEANREWHTALSSVAGIYAILYDGQLYIGKASGAKGIIGRWKNYIPDGHGGNEKLKDLLRHKPNAKHDFQFSVLQALSPSLSGKQVAAMESLWKKKLGSRKGLNRN